MKWNENAALIGLLALGVFVALLASTEVATANPTGPDNATISNATHRDDSTSGNAVGAQAGNVTMLFINDTRTTLRWQGYYGNVTGRVTLDDANTNTLYDWSLTSPQGEVYASNTSTVNWNNIQCFVMNATSVNQTVTLTDLENALGMQPGDKDGVNETFNYTWATTFKVGATTINAQSNCSGTYLYVNDGPQTTKFKETILTDNSTTGNIVYTAILEQDQTGFQGTSLDFEMLVGENGDVNSATTYYFFVELE